MLYHVRMDVRPPHDIDPARFEALKAEGVKIVTLVRGEQVIMAHHDTVIENGDHVILFLSDKRHVEQVERLFQT